MSTSNFKYTTDGRKVVVIGSLNSQEKIVQEVFIVGDAEVPSGENFTVKALHDAPAVSWKEKSIKEWDAAYERASKLHDERLKKLHDMHRDVEERMNYVGKVLKNVSRETFDTLILLLTDRAKWVVIGGYCPRIIEWKHERCQYGKDRLRLLSLFGLDDGTFSFRRSAYSDGSDSGSGDEFFVFATHDEAKKKWLEVVGDRIGEHIIKTADEHGIGLPKESLAKWRRSQVDAANKSIEDLKRKIEEHRLRIDALATGGAATKEPVGNPTGAKRTTAKRGRGPVKATPKTKRK